MKRGDIWEIKCRLLVSPNLYVYRCLPLTVASLPAAAMLLKLQLTTVSSQQPGGGEKLLRNKYELTVVNQQTQYLNDASKSLIIYSTFYSFHLRSLFGFVLLVTFSSKNELPC